jgi:GcrA cell cycle regulator
MTDTFTRGCYHSGWTLDREDLLKKLHKEGLSASQIAARITSTGFECSRNAVIGKANRMGLAGGDKPRRSTRSPRKHKPRAQRPPHYGDLRKSAKLFATYTQPEAYLPGPELVIPEKERRGVIDLERAQCRWPIGDPQHADFHFCNGVQVPGLPYCEHHARRAYQPPQARRREAANQFYGDAMLNNARDLLSGDVPINTREKADA